MKERLEAEIDIVEKMALRYEGSGEIWKLSVSDVEKDIVTVANGFLRREEDRFPIGDFEVWYDWECTKNNWEKAIAEATEKDNWDGINNLILEEGLFYLSRSQSSNQKEDFRVGYGLVRLIKWRLWLAGKEVGDKIVQ